MMMGSIVLLVGVFFLPFSTSKRSTSGSPSRVWPAKLGDRLVILFGLDCMLSGVILD